MTEAKVKTEKAKTVKLSTLFKVALEEGATEAHYGYMFVATGEEDKDGKRNLIADVPADLAEIEVKSGRLKKA